MSVSTSSAAIQHDAESPLIPLGHSYAERQHAFIRRVLMVFGILGGLGKALDNGGRSRQIRIANTEVDDIDSTGNGRLLHLIDGSEQIGRQCLDAGRDFDGETCHDRHISFLQRSFVRNKPSRLLQEYAGNQRKNAADKDQGWSGVLMQPACIDTIGQSHYPPPDCEGRLASWPPRFTQFRPTSPH